MKTHEEMDSWLLELEKATLAHDYDLMQKTREEILVYFDEINKRLDGLLVLEAVHFPNMTDVQPQTFTATARIDELYKIPDDYRLRFPLAITGAYTPILTCSICAKNVQVLFTFEKPHSPDIVACTDCALDWQARQDQKEVP
jgi:hypothetical protein